MDFKEEHQKLKQWKHDKIIKSLQFLKEELLKKEPDFPLYMDRNINNFDSENMKNFFKRKGSSN